MTALADKRQGILDALEPLKAQVPGLQVYGWRNGAATPPSLDVYPGDPFQIGAAFGLPEKRAWFIVRARVTSADQEAQGLLFRMLDPEDPASVEAAIAAADAGVVADDDGYVSGFRDDVDGLMSCEWRVTVWL